MVYSLWSIALYALWGVAAKGREKRLTIDYRLLTYFFSLPHAGETKEKLYLCSHDVPLPSTSGGGEE